MQVANVVMQFAEYTILVSFELLNDFAEYISVSANAKRMRYKSVQYNSVLLNDIAKSICCAL